MSWHSAQSWRDAWNVLTAISVAVALALLLASFELIALCWVCAFPKIAFAHLTTLMSVLPSAIGSRWGRALAILLVAVGLNCFFPRQRSEQAWQLSVPLGTAFLAYLWLCAASPIAVTNASSNPEFATHQMDCANATAHDSPTKGKTVSSSGDAAPNPAITAAMSRQGASGGAAQRDSATNAGSSGASSVAGTSQSSSETKDPRTEAFRLEVEKVNKEIEGNHQSEGNCFQYRFGLVGALLAALFYFLGSKGQGHDLNSLLRKPETLMVLGFACLISIVIDAHVRSTAVATDYIAQWIYLEGEPALLGRVASRSCLYEAFLRTEGAMHRSWHYRYSFWPQLQLFTGVLYVLYLFVLERICLPKGPAGESAKVVAIFTFVLVHVVLLCFAVSAHVAPGGEGWGVQPYFPWPEKGEPVKFYRNVVCRAAPILLIAGAIGIRRFRRRTHTQAHPAQRESPNMRHW